MTSSTAPSRKVQSPEEPGWHVVISPEKSECTAAHVFRLNLPAGRSHTITTGELEMHPLLIHGRAELSEHPDLDGELNRFDGFYLPSEQEITVTALEDCVFYIGGAPDDGIGKPVLTPWNADTPLGDVHQIHGEGTSRREVMFTLPAKVPASRLICGLTWGGQGTWTSWPPHQHEEDLEEVYCYFDMEPPRFGLHLGYASAGRTDEIVAHPVSSGSFVEVPDGYHPTVATPGTTNTYLWILAAHRPSSRSYDLAIEDPTFENLRG